MDEQRERRRLERFAFNRRGFLKASAGSMAAMAVHSAYSMDALAQDDPAVVGLQFLTDAQAATVEALAEQIWPTTDDSPGGRDAGVLYYIDNALAGKYAEYQEVYRVGLDWLDAVSEQEQGAIFRELGAEQQTELLTAIFASGEEQEGDGAVATPPQIEVEGIPIQQATPVAGELPPEGQPTVAGIADPQIGTLQDFMDLVVTHTMEGLFADPIYGGNRDFAGWRAVGYPGAHYIYTEEEQQTFEPLDKPLQSIADL